MQLVEGSLANTCQSNIASFAAAGLQALNLAFITPHGAPSQRVVLLGLAMISLTRLPVNRWGWN